MIRIDSSPRSTSAREVTISATYSPAPDSRHSRRNAAFVTPAMGASTTGVSIVIGGLLFAFILLQRLIGIRFK